jgi:hypothetical protein
VKLKTICLWIPLFLGLLLVLLRLPNAVTSPQLDRSWDSALSYFSDQHMQFGKDIIFTFGPMGYLYSSTYSGYLIESRIIWELLSKALMVILLLFIANRAGWLLGCLFIVNIFLFMPSMNDALSLFTITFLLALITQYEDQRLLALGGSVFLAFVSLIKFSLFIASITGLLSIAFYWGWRGKWFVTGSMVGTYVVALLVLWHISGQDLHGVIPYLQSSMEISTGYAQTMFLNEFRPVLLLGAGTLVLIMIVILGLNIYPAMDGKSLIIAGLLAEGLAISWKHGFIRADMHVTIFFSFSQLTLVGAWALARLPIAHKRTLLALTFVGIFLAGVGTLFGGPRGYRYSILPRVWNRIQFNAVALADMPRYVRSLRHELSLAKARYALPTIKNMVKQERVDVFGHEQGIALLNDLNYRPRPVFQSYSAYNPFLVSVNRDFYLSRAAPRFVLFKLQTIDFRLPAADDSATLDILLHNYTPVAADGGYFLWQQRDAAPSLPPRRLLKDGSAGFYDKIDLPRDQPVLWAQIEWSTSLLGKLRALLYKPAEVSIQLTSDTGRSESFRLVEPLARASFIISPLFHDATDVVNFVKGMPVNRPLSFQLEGSPLYYSRFHYRLYTASDFPNRSN